MQRSHHPGGLVVGAFGSLIGLGTVLLSLPVSHRTTTANSDISIADAFFTAVSAVTVTGLTVVDTGTEWSRFGELVLLVLIQIGGLGIMTLAGFIGIILNRRLGVRAGLSAGAEIGLADLGTLRRLVRDIVAFVLVTEFVVAILLTIRFHIEDDHRLLHSIHLGVFHSVSAFNNAGFSVINGGLERYVDDWYINIVIALTFIIGGLGFPVVFEIRRRWRTPHAWTLHTKVTLTVTAALLTAGTLMIALVEWTNDSTLGSHGTPTKILASFFQSATSRTAGFHTLDVSALRGGTWLALILLMVVGASSASTGGGIKTSTFAVVIKATISEFRQDPQVSMFDRRISRAVQRQALALVVAALGTVGTATFFLTIINNDIEVAQLLFEATSAFGTVGLSTGVTNQLDTIGRLAVAALMFIGRVGPITFGTAVLLRREPKAYDYAKEDLIVG